MARYRAKPTGAKKKKTQAAAMTEILNETHNHAQKAFCTGLHIQFAKY